MKLFELHSIWTERVPLRACGHASGPAGHNEGKSSWREDRAAHQGIARGSEEGDQCADRQAQQCAATDAHAICDHVPEFHGPSG